MRATLELSEQEIKAAITEYLRHRGVTVSGVSLHSGGEQAADPERSDMSKQYKEIVQEAEREGWDWEAVSEYLHTHLTTEEYALLPFEEYRAKYEELKRAEENR